MGEPVEMAEITETFDYPTKSASLRLLPIRQMTCVLTFDFPELFDSGREMLWGGERDFRRRWVNHAHWVYSVHGSHRSWILIESHQELEKLCGSLIDCRGALIDRRGEFIDCRGDFIYRRGALIDCRELIAYALEEFVDSTELIVSDFEVFVDSMELIVYDFETFVDSRELIVYAFEAFIDYMELNVYAF